MFATRLYYLHPLLAGPVDAWAAQLDRVAAMRFDTVAIAPPFAAGRAGDLFLTADHDRFDERFGVRDAAAGLERFARDCRARQLLPMLDVVVDRVAVEHAQNGLADWYRPDASDELPDPRRPPQRPDVARLFPEGDMTGAVDWWARRLVEWIDAGITGFRCTRPHQVPAEFWHDLMSAVRRERPGVGFMAAPLDREPAESERLAQSGFDLVTFCSGNWDYRSEDFADTVNRLAHIAAVIAMPEAPFDHRLGRGFRDTGRAQRAARRALAFTTAYGAGWMMPMGFEFGATRDMDAARDRPEDFERLVAEAPFDLSADIATTNSRCAATSHGSAASIRSLTPPDAPAAALLVQGRANRAPRLVLANASLDDPVRLELAPLLIASGLDGALVDDPAGGVPTGPDATITIAPAEILLLHVAAAPPISRPQRSAVEAAATSRIAIEAVAPSIDEGRFPAKRLVGELVEVAADLISDGHERLAAALLWRPADEEAWGEVPMAAIGNDRWVGRFPLGRIGRHVFTILAWKDHFGNFTEELEKKHAAGLSIDLELEEGRLLVEGSITHAVPEVAPALEALAKQLRDADAEERRRLLLTPATAALMASARIRPH
ncbi:MAG TPA: maltotransferase domain-containing protein, partial [Stellaceae bacterium]|nr:maltotransferase domain-containing protein [Stellaceae bacterium]